MPEISYGKLRTQDRITARSLTWAPWILMGVTTIPLPLVLFFFFLVSASTDSAAFFFLLSFVSLGLGFVVGLLIVILFWLYRRRWNLRLRDRLAADGITAEEVPWFQPELSSEEKKTWRDLEKMNPLLADAYCETLAARLTATRISTRARGEILRIERQINRTRHLREASTSSLVSDLLEDRQRAELLRDEAKVRLAEAKARLQTIEAAARRELSQSETDLMLKRLSASQDQLPLALEIARLERGPDSDVPAAHLSQSSMGTRNSTSKSE